MNERDLFFSALDVKDPEARQEFLQAACADDAALLARVQSLFSAHADNSRFLKVPIVEQMPDEVSGAIATTIMHADGSTVDVDRGMPDQKARETDTLAESAANWDVEIASGLFDPPKRPESLGRLRHYEVEEVVGQGAFGTVFKAVDEKLERVVAIKILAPELAATSAARKRFLREARASASIRHDNVISIHDVGNEPTPYLVMEYIPGQTLQERLDERGPFNLPDVLKIGKQIADGLAAAHAGELIHRDVKPGNILIEPGSDDHVKITDFGLARTADDASMTQSGIIAGTPLYMAPEQAAGERLDQRADLFSFGSVLYYMLTGRSPFAAKSTMAVLKRVAEDEPRPIKEIAPQTPEWLCRIIARLHAKNPDDRFESAHEVGRLLEKCLIDLQAGRTPQIPASELPRKPSPVAGPEPATSRPVFKNRLAATGALLAVLIIGLGITEATGVTQLASTVVRLVVGSGTLVIESVEPGVSVAIDGENITIRGGGVEELTLRPGDYKLAASKDGRQVMQEIVTITRNGRTTIRLSLEPPIAAKSPSSDRAATNKVVLERTLEGHETPIYALVYSPNGKLLASGGDGEVRVWDVESKSLRYVLPGIGNERFTAIAFSPDGKYLLTAPQAAPAPIGIWNAETGESAGALKGHQQKLYEISFSPDGKYLVSGGFDSFIRLWDFSKRQKLKDVPSESRWCRSAVFSSQGRMAYGQDKIILAEKDGTPIRTIDTTAAPLCFSPNGRLLAGTTWTQGLVTVWEVETGKEIASWKAHDGYAEGVAFSRDNNMIATAGSDGKIRLWDSKTQSKLAELSHAKPANWVAFSPDGMTLATTGHDGLIKFWNISSLLARRKPWSKQDDERIAALPADQQILEVEKELRTRNPKFNSQDARITHRIELGVVRELAIVGLKEDDVTDISPVRALSGLKSFECRSGQKLWDLSPLSDLKLDHLSVGGWALTDLSQIKNLNPSTLNIEYSSVRDLSPLENMTALRELIIFQTAVKDLTPLADLKLTSLNLGRTSVADLSPIKELKLTSLQFDETHVSDLSPLEGMKLTSLSFYNVPVSDLSPLMGMPLAVLNCKGTKVTDLSPLKDSPISVLECDFLASRDAAILREIKTLKTINGKPAERFWKDVSARAKNIEQIAALPAKEQISAVTAELKRLNPSFDGTVHSRIEKGKVVELSFDTEYISNIAPIAALQDLRTLTCVGRSSTTVRGKLADISPLKGLPISTLILDYNPISDLSPLRGMPLKRLECYSTKISDVSPLADTTVEHLHLSYSQVEDLLPLRDLKLKILFVEGMPINDLSPLQGMPLKKLGLYATEVKDLSPLRGMPLEYLNCEATKVTDLSPLSGMPLTTLCISRTGVSDLSPLKGMPLSDFLYETTPITDVSVLRELPLKLVWADFQPDRDERVWRSIPTLQTINAKAAEEFWKSTSPDGKR